MDHFGGWTGGQGEIERHTPDHSGKIDNKDLYPISYKGLGSIFTFFLYLVHKQSLFTLNLFKLFFFLNN